MLKRDLSILEEVKDFSEKLLKVKAIDVLINNAGALFNDREVTPEGFEKLALLSFAFCFNGKSISQKNPTQGHKCIFRRNDTRSY